MEEEEEKTGQEFKHMETEYVQSEYVGKSVLVWASGQSLCS